jgi:energy-coupling factor transport system substrate-specific component
MRELVTMWGKTQMVVLTAVCAALYVAVLVPFKAFVIIPGYTEIRPGVAVPFLCGILFGPAGAWGAAIGNLVGDILGAMFGLGTIAGFFGNFLFAYVPYRIWAAQKREKMRSDTSEHRVPVIRLVLTAVLASGACGLAIGWGVEVLRAPVPVPPVVLANIIAINNSIVAGILAPILFILLYPRVRNWHLLYYDIAPELHTTATKLLFIFGMVLLVVGVGGGLVVANLLHLHVALPYLSQSVVAGTAPFIFLTVIGAFLL